MQPQELGADAAAKLTPDELKALLDDMAQITERAYRRGYQHGFLARLGVVKATPDEVANWRFERPADEPSGAPHYAKAIAPPGTACTGDEWELIERLEKETLVESALSGLVAEHKSQMAD